MKGYSITRDTSPHAFGMRLPAIEDAQSNLVARRQAEAGSFQLRRAILQYEMKHHPDAKLQVAK